MKNDSFELPSNTTQDDHLLQFIYLHKMEVIVEYLDLYPHVITILEKDLCSNPQLD